MRLNSQGESDVRQSLSSGIQTPRELPNVYAGYLYEEEHPLRNHIVRKPLDINALYQLKYTPKQGMEASVRERSPVMVHDGSWRTRLSLKNRSAMGFSFLSYLPKAPENIDQILNKTKP